MFSLSDFLEDSCGWVGGENEINANSAFKYVGVEVEAELGKKHLIWPSQCKYAFSDVCPRGSAAVDMLPSSVPVG